MITFSTNKNIQVNKSPSLNKNLTPIKVRKKASLMNKINSIDSSRNFRPIHKINNNIRNTEIIILNNLNKYASHPSYFYKKITNQILFNFPHHLVSVFKDYLIWNGNYDYFKNFYCRSKSEELLPKIGNYYETYTLFTPIYFPLFDLSYIIRKYIKIKMKYLEMTEGDDDLREQIKDLEKNILDDAINIENNNITENKEAITNESNKENNNKKLINSTDIKTENSNSVSNYFGIDSIIKSKETINISTNENDYNSCTNNYPLLDQIKINNNNKNDNNKVNPDFSLELASIIQSFESNQSNFYNKINSNNKSTLFIKRNSKDLLKNRMNLKIGKNSKSNTNINNIKLKNFSKKVSNSLKNKNNRKTKYNNIFIPSKRLRMNSLLINYNMNKYRLSLKNKINYSNHALPFKKEKNHSNNKSNIRVNQRHNLRKMCKSFIEGKNIDKSNTFINLKRPSSIKEKNFKNSYSKSNDKKKLIKTKSKESITYVKIKNSNNKRKHSKLINKKIINLSTNYINKKKFNETKEYSIIYTSPQFKLKDSFKSTNRSRNYSNNNSISQIKDLYLKRDFSFISDNKKFIFVNKAKGKNNSIYSKKFGQLMNIINSSINNDENNINTKKISVNKIDNLSRKDIKKVKAQKTKPTLNIININNLKDNSCINNYKNSTKTEYDNIIPKYIIKKMFYNKIKGEPTNKRNSPIKRKNISTNYLNTWSSSAANNINSKHKLNNNINHILHEEPIPKLYSNSKKVNKNKRILTEYNNFKKFIPKNRNEVKSPLNIKNINNSKNESKFTIFSINENGLIFERNNNFLKTNNNSNLENSLFNKAHIETNKIKNYKALKTNYINKSNIEINHGSKFNSPSSDKKVKIKQKKKLNNTLNLPYINKNKIRDLIKNFGFNNKYERKPNELISQKKNIRKNNYNYSNESSTTNTKKFSFIK